MADQVKPDISRSVAWLRKSLGKPSGGGTSAPGDGRLLLRDLFADLFAYVLFFQATCEQRPPSFAEVREKITRLIEDQEKRVKAGEFPWESYQEARFPVLSWVDEVILTSAWPHRTQWHPLMLTFYGMNVAGEEFYEHLKTLPTAAQDVRELYYLTLELGYLGEHALADSAGYLRELRHGLYRQLSGAPNDIRQQYPRLFPEAYRKPPSQRPATAPRIHPIWYGVLLLLPVLLFIIFAFFLRRETNRLIAQIAKPAVVEPVAAGCAKPGTLIEALRCKGIKVQETPRGIVVTLEGALFAVNSIELNPEGAVKMGEVGQIVRQYAPDRVMAIEGHASREPGTPEERNQRLSDGRAKTAAGVLLGAGIRPEKISTRGFGSSRPVASNDIEDGRRQNRRVELIIEKT